MWTYWRWWVSNSSLKTPGDLSGSNPIVKAGHLYYLLSPSILFKSSTAVHCATAFVKQVALSNPAELAADPMQWLSGTIDQTWRLKPTSWLWHQNIIVQHGVHTSSTKSKFGNILSLNVSISCESAIFLFPIRSFITRSSSPTRDRIGRWVMGEVVFIAGQI